MTAWTCDAESDKLISKSLWYCGKKRVRESKWKKDITAAETQKDREKMMGGVQRKESGEMKEATMRAHHIWDRIPEPQNEKTLRMSK